MAAERGLILVDTKFEFGLDPAGRITLADEILTPDSSRYWKAQAMASAMARARSRKTWTRNSCACGSPRAAIPIASRSRRFRRTTLIEFTGKYIALYESVTARNSPRPRRASPSRARIRRNLAPFFPGAV